MVFPEFFPWQTEFAQQWLGQRNRFAHAWLIYGQQGIGKRQLAYSAAAALLCEHPEQHLACGHCSACQWIRTGNHPDLRLIRPDAIAFEEGDPALKNDNETATTPKALSRDIRVDQIRSLGHWFNTATHRGGFRVAVLYPANAMNTITANALLKVLEEPPAHTVFFLVVDAPDALLPTIVSRCRLLAAPFPSQTQGLAWLTSQGIKQAKAWLAVAGNAPLLAYEQASKADNPCPEWMQSLMQSLVHQRLGDMSELANQLEKEPTAHWIDMQQRLLIDLLLLHYGLSIRYFIEYQDLLLPYALQLDPVALSEQGKWLAQQRSLASHPLNAKVWVQTALQRLFLSCKPVAMGS